MQRFARPLVAAFLILAAGVAAAAGSTLGRIQSAKVITLGYMESSAPFSFDQAGEPAGYSVDLCKRAAEGIAKQLGVIDLKTRWVKLKPADRIAAVKSGAVDIECGTTTATLSRSEDVDFSAPIFVDGASLLVQADSSARTLQDLAGKKIAVIPGTTTENVLRAALAGRSVDAQVVTVADRPAALAALRERKVHGYASDRVILLGMALSAGGQGSFRVLDEDFSFEPYALVLPRDDSAFRLAVNRVLAGLYRTKEIEGVYNRWFGKLGRPSLLLSAMYHLNGYPE